MSVAIIHSREKGKLREIEKKIGKTFERKEVPTPQHIIEKQLYNLADRIERVKVDDGEIDKYIPGVQRKLEWLSQEDLLKRVLSLEFQRLLEYYKDAPKIDFIDEKPAKERTKKEREPRTEKDKDRRTAERGMERIYVNVGKADGFFAGNLIDLLNHTVDGSRVDVGRIDLLPHYSLFDVKKADAKRVVNALKNAEFMGKNLYSEIASADKDYKKASLRRTKDAAAASEFDGGGETPFEYFRKKSRGGSKKASKKRR